MSREGLGLREGDGPENCSDRDLYLGMELSGPEIPTLDQGESYQFLANLEMQRFLYPGTQPCPIPPLQHTQEGCPGRARVGNETSGCPDSTEVKNCGIWAPASSPSALEKEGRGLPCCAAGGAAPTLPGWGGLAGPRKGAGRPQ